MKVWRKCWCWNVITVVSKFLRLTLKSTRILYVFCDRPFWRNPLVNPVGVFTDVHSAGFWEWSIECGSVAGQFCSTVSFIEESALSSSACSSRRSFCSSWESSCNSVPALTVWGSPGRTLLRVLSLLALHVSLCCTSDSGHPWEHSCDETCVRADCGWCWDGDDIDLCKCVADCTMDRGERRKLNSKDFCGESVMGWGESGEAGCISGWDISGEHFAMGQDEWELAGCVTSWGNSGCDCVMHWSTCWGDCCGKYTAGDCRTKSGRRYTCICSCRCSFGIGVPDGLGSVTVSLGSIPSALSCACEGGDCLSQPARDVPKLHW